MSPSDTNHPLNRFFPPLLLINWLVNRHDDGYLLQRLFKSRFRMPITRVQRRTEFRVGKRMRSKLCLGTWWVKLSFGSLTTRHISVSVGLEERRGGFKWSEGKWAGAVWKRSTLGFWFPGCSYGLLWYWEFLGAETKVGSIKAHPSNKAVPMNLISIYI